MSQQQPARIDPKQVRPGRFWYLVAAIVMVVGFAAGGVVFALGLSAVVDEAPDMDAMVAPDTPTEVALTTDREWAVYVDHADSPAPAVECRAESSDGEVTLESPNSTFTYSDGEHRWHLVYEVSVSADGDYTFDCGSDAAVETFAVGEAVDVGGFVGGVFGTIGGLFGLGCFGLVVGGVIILVVALRRSSNRKELQRRAAAPDHPGAW